MNNEIVLHTLCPFKLAYRVFDHELNKIVQFEDANEALCFAQKNNENVRAWINGKSYIGAISEDTRYPLSNRDGRHYFKMITKLEEIKLVLVQYEDEKKNKCRRVDIQNSVDFSSYALYLGRNINSFLESSIDKLLKKEVKEDGNAIQEQGDTSAN